MVGYRDIDEEIIDYLEKNAKRGFSPQFWLKGDITFSVMPLTKDFKEWHDSVNEEKFDEENYANLFVNKITNSYDGREEVFYGKATVAKLKEIFEKYCK